MAGMPDIKMSPAGLHTNPSTQEVPSGGLLEAEDIVIRRPGVAEPRPGFSYETTWGSLGDDIRTLHAFGTRRLAIYANGTSPAAEWSDGQDVTDEAGNAPEFGDFTDSAAMRGNLYLTGSDRVRKVTSSGSGTAYRAGPPPTVYATVTTVSGANEAISANLTVAVKVVVMREDANGVQVRSAPSFRQAVTNGAAARDLSFTVTLHDEDASVGFLEGDTLEFYRTLEVDGTPEEEYFLSHRYELTASDLSAGEITVVDRTPEDSLGLALYTNDNVEGAEATHLQPFAAKCLAEFNSSLWAGDLTYPAQLILALTYWPAATDGQVGVHEFDGDFTNGSNQIANVSPATGTMAQFKVGQIVHNDTFTNEWASATTEYARITAINSTTLTISQNYTGATATKTRFATDSIRIGSQYFPTGSVRQIRHSYQAREGVGPASTEVTAEYVGTISGTVYKAEMAITHWDPSASFTIYATHGSLYDPPLPEPSATGLTVEPDHIPNGVAWSNAREPEHWKVSNLERVGDDTKAVMRLAPVGNTILIYKADGMHKAAGFEESGVRFDRHDQSIRLLYPAALTFMKEQVYCWAESGVYVCDESGCRLISLPVADKLTPLQQEIGAGSTTARGAWAVANPKDNEVLFSVPASGALNTGTVLFVYNVVTDTWVNWLRGETLRAGVYSSSRLSIQGASDFTRQERLLAGSGAFYTTDRAFGFTISAVDGLDVTIDSGSGWTPAVGDVVSKSGVDALVTEVTDATHFAVDSALTTGAGFSGTAYTSIITPIASTAKNPSLLKTWGEGTVWWASTYGLLHYVTRFTSALSQTPADQTRTLRDTRTTTDVAEAFRFVTPRNHSMTTRLYPSVRITQGGSRWRLEAINVDYRHLGQRVRAK